MPIKKSAMKAMRQSKKTTLKNFQLRKNVKDLIRASQKSIETKNQNEAAQKVKEAIKAIDRAVQKKVYKKNAGARKKSRLMKKLNQLAK